MPITHIHMRAGKPAAYRQAVMDGIYAALREALQVPEGDAFLTITEHEAANFRYGHWPDMARSDDVLYIEVSVFSTRTVQQKKALYQAIARQLAAAPGVRPQDVFVHVLDAPKENWSLGMGLAQFA